MNSEKDALREEQYILQVASDVLDINKDENRTIEHILKHNGHEKQIILKYFPVLSISDIQVEETLQKVSKMSYKDIKTRLGHIRNELNQKKKV